MAKTYRCLNTQNVMQQKQSIKLFPKIIYLIRLGSV